MQVCVGSKFGKQLGTLSLSFYFFWLSSALPLLYYVLVFNVVNYFGQVIKCIFDLI